MKDDDINSYVPSILNPRCLRKNSGGTITQTQNSVVSRCSLSLKRNKNGNVTQKKGGTVKIPLQNKENLSILINGVHDTPKLTEERRSKKTVEEVGGSIGFSAIEDLVDRNSNFIDSNSPTLDFIQETIKYNDAKIKNDVTLLSFSSVTELDPSVSENSENKTTLNICEANDVNKPLVSLSFGFTNCDNVNISTKHSNIKQILVSHENDNICVDCDLEEGLLSQGSSPSSDCNNNMKQQKVNPLKRSSVAVSLEIKKKKFMSEEGVMENNKVLILNTDAIEKITHVIVQPPNYKLVKKQVLNINKFNSSNQKKSVSRSPCKNGIFLWKSCDHLKQKCIDAYFKKTDRAEDLSALTDNKIASKGTLHYVPDLINNCNDTQVMSKSLGVSNSLKPDHQLRSSRRASRNELCPSPRSIKLSVTRNEFAPKRQDIKTSNSDARSSPLSRNSGSSHSPKRNVDSINFSLPSKTKSTKNHSVFKHIPHHKIVAGTHFAVDAFSYGEIPNVKHYFLTHFHSDHYSGLKKSFNKLLFCSKITADLCVARLFVNPKCIHVLKLDEVVHVDGVEVTAVDANHCPGAIMLVFTLPNGKTILHTGDFRATPAMESSPIFWNKDIHTIYLDTTYCNPRYDFPTQDQSLDMALYYLRQKKMALEKESKKFSSVLIVCGTYTIGKEKFFLGMARRVGCSVWACPEKNRVLQAVEGRSFSHAPPSSCQLHVVPMRDLTIEKLRTYLDSLQGAFSEVVAFKPSGWENGKNSTVEKDRVTIHGIPYSEHSSFSELIRFVKYLKPKQVVPTVDISGGIKAVQKYFPCPLVAKEDTQNQSRVTDFFSIQSRQQITAVT